MNGRVAVAASLAVIAFVCPITPSSAQRAETPAERCSWEGWLPPAAGRTRVRDAAQLAPLREVALRSELRSTSKARRQQAALKLGASRETASVDALLGLTNDPEPQVVDAAVRSLGRIGDRRATSRLIALANASDTHVRQGTAWALGQLEDPIALSALIVSTRDTSKHVRSEAAWALGLVGGRDAVARLIELTRDRNEHVRLAALCSLAKTSSRQREVGVAVAALRTDSAAVVREVAVWALGQISR